MPDVRPTFWRRLFVGRQGRLRAAWRIVVFVGVVILVALAVSGLALLVGVDLAAPAFDVLVSLVALLVASAYMMRRVERLPVAALGLPRGGGALRAGLRGAALGAALIGAVVLLFVAAGWVRWVPQAGRPIAWLAALVGYGAFFAVAAFGEELLARGYPFQVVAERLGGAWAIALTSVVFGLLHLGNPNVALIPITNIALAGVLLGIAYWRTYSLWFATGIHAGWNWSMSFAADLPVSGLVMDTPLYDARTNGPELWTGGAFGPEGGLSVTIAALVVAVWMARTPRLRRDPQVVALGPLPDRRRLDEDAEEARGAATRGAADLGGGAETSEDS